VAVGSVTRLLFNPMYFSPSLFGKNKRQKNNNNLKKKRKKKEEKDKDKEIQL